MMDAVPQRIDAAPRGGRRSRAGVVLVLCLVAVLAAAGFAAWRTAPVRTDPRAIHLTVPDQARIAAAFAARTGVPPSPAEAEEAVAAWVREEVLYREALRRLPGAAPGAGRAALARRMEAALVAEDGPIVPDTAELAEWLARHRSRYAADAAATFDQVTFATRGRAVVGRALIAGGADWERVGDASPFPEHFESARSAAMTDTFGALFAGELRAMVPGPQWQGPVRSTHGWHLVRLRALEPGALPPLEAVRARVAADWIAAARQDRAEAAYRRLRAQYTVSLER